METVARGRTCSTVWLCAWRAHHRHLSTEAATGNHLLHVESTILNRNQHVGCPTFPLQYYLSGGWRKFFLSIQEMRSPKLNNWSNLNI